ncbi:immunoglobulin-like domain-containing protein [Enterococcus sp. AZ126]|uniref:immunoglobulin-like domain-containing protein n=1 Tax=Enterococcus sp. AZ126 TaxID=2774635 RepID=UPI003F238F7D
MKVKKLFTTLLTTTLISQSLLPVMQVRAEETQSVENTQAVEAKVESDTNTSETQIQTDAGAIDDDTAAKAAVDNLFRDEMHTLLDDKTSQVVIDAAKTVVEALPIGEAKTKLMAEIKKAQDLLDKNNSEKIEEQAAKEAVDNLFTNESHTALKDETTEASIHFTEKLVQALPTGEVKTQLAAEIKKALDILSAGTSTDPETENDAYWIGKATEFLDYVLKDGVSQAISEKSFTEVEKYIEKIQKDTTKKAELSKKLAEARRQYNYNKELEASVMNLFLTNTKLKPNVTQEMIDSLSAKTLDVVNDLWRTFLQQPILGHAQRLLDAENKPVKEAVNNLFTTDAHTALKDTTTQATIDAAKKLVDALPTGEVKTQLTAEIKKAQALLGLVNDSKIDVDNYEMGSSRYVKGTISGKAIKKVALEINGKLKKAINASTGPFQYWAVGQIMTEKDQVFVIGLDTSGNEINRTKVNIIPAESTVNLTVSAFVIGKDNYITGTYEGNVKTVALRIDGVLTQKIAVKDGVIKYYAKGKILKSSSKVELVAIDELGKEIASKAVKVSDVIASMKVNLYKLGEGYIQGTYTGDAKYMAIEVNGRMLQTIGITNGVLKYYAKGKINFVDDKVNIILLDGNRAEIQRTPLKMLGTPGMLAFISYKLNAPYITGTYIGGIVKVRVSVNGIAQRVIPVSNNKFQYYARNLITKKYDYAKVEGLDSSNNVLDMKIVVITK